MTLLRRFLLFLFLLSLPNFLQAQKLVNKRSSFYAFTGVSGAKLREFNEMLADRGLSPLRNRYRTYGLGYQARINDFILGLELSQHQSKVSELDEFEIRYRTSRALVNVGYSLTEEGRFQLIHYMSIGVGYLNFEMLPAQGNSNLADFLQKPQEGFILRENNIQKGTQYFGDFLTEIGFQLSYDFDLPGRKEAVQVLAKVGYSFSPFEGKWEMNGYSFDNTQSGAFVRVGAGISLPDRNFFYKDASIGVSFFKGFHFTKPEKFNNELMKQGYQPLPGTPSNWGLRVLGETEGLLYGVDVFNSAMEGPASNYQNQSLNSLRVYANGGMKFFQFKNFAVGAMGGIGYGNIRYTLSQNEKPNFPELFEQRYFDGYLKSSGMMAKPEIMVEYGIPMTNRKLFDLVVSASAGYELALGNYRLGDLGMAEFLSAPMIGFSVGVRP
ncbi:hypothetical protein [Algoriphagus terrigena]|uniref:hypothetical protein n=1 Tax=Algoriphagus terrigena TaxID=344884 RepID=UPI0004214D79|nr:hypothetical protein [Algoriphagus terrigena]